MATFLQLPSGNWRAVLRRKARYVSETFRRKCDADSRALGKLDTLIAHLDGNPRQVTPLGRIVRFAVATAMRQSEIAAIVWPDVDDRLHTVVVRDRKDPRNKDGNHQRVLLRQPADGTDTNPRSRVAELERRRAEIDGEITRIRGGSLTLIDATGVRERFQQITDNARAVVRLPRGGAELPGAHRAARERIATWDGGKT